MIENLTITRASHVDDGRRTGDNHRVVHRTTRASFFPCARVGKAVWKAIRPLRCPDTELCTIHSPYYRYYSFQNILTSRKAIL